jgi:hypothetical protein
VQLSLHGSHIFCLLRLLLVLLVLLLLLRPVVCGTLNAAVQQRCGECGAARWDGPGGQLQLRLLAALRTADLDTTSVKQVSSAAGSNPMPRPCCYAVHTVNQAQGLPCMQILYSIVMSGAEQCSVMCVAHGRCCNAAFQQQVLRCPRMTAGSMCYLFVQVAARLAAESGSNPSLGLQLPAPAVKAEVAAFLATRNTLKAAAAGPPPATAAAAPSPGSGVGRTEGPQETLGRQLLPPGCPDVASNVYTSLLTWLQQQQQQQQPSADGAAIRLQGAAAAAAALAPALITGVFRQQNKLPEGGSKLVSNTFTLASCPLRYTTYTT